MKTQETLKISARNAGQVELAKYCPRCCWFLLHLKRFPYQMGMPGIMFFMEQAQKAFILSYLSEYKNAPACFGPFADCTTPVEFPFSMQHEHTESGVLVTAQVDLMLRKKDGTICLLDLKTSKVGGGGEVYLPQYEIQVTGYSWVAEACELGKIGTAGLLYCDIQLDRFKNDPLAYMNDKGFLVPFDFHPHEVTLDYKRFSKCLKEVNRVWKEERPPKGTDNCKDCMLLNRLLDFEDQLRASDEIRARWSAHDRHRLVTQNYYRDVIRGGYAEGLVDASGHFDSEGGMWANWDFADAPLARA